MLTRGGLAPGQRWRSYVDGHTIVTVDRPAKFGDRWLICFDESGVMAAMHEEALREGYEFVEIVEQLGAID